MRFPVQMVNNAIFQIYLYREISPHKRKSNDSSDSQNTHENTHEKTVIAKKTPFLNPHICKIRRKKAKKAIFHTTKKNVHTTKTYFHTVKENS